MGLARTLLSANVMQARELMTKKPTFIAEKARIREAVDILQSMEIRHLPVVNDDREVVGMLSDRDLREVRSESLDSRVTDIMSSNVFSVEEEDDIEDAVELMLENKIGAVPVVDGDGALVGIISYVDVLRAAHFD
jgi:acetoin utilization protein AcuB